MGIRQEYKKGDRLRGCYRENGEIRPVLDSYQKHNQLGPDKLDEGVNRETQGKKKVQNLIPKDF